MAHYLLGVDTGGTFTDFVLYDGATLRVHKRLSTPHAPEEAILAGITELGVPLNELTVVHGSTVATNAALENKGVKTAYVTNYGFGDVLTIGRQARDQLYSLQPEPRQPPVPAQLCFETGGRVGADGCAIEPLTTAELARLREQIVASGVEAVAINLLFSHLDDRFEKAIAAVIPPDIFVSRSSAVLPEYKEYERGITTWLNAWIGPVAQRYLMRLQSSLAGRPLCIMQSNGGTMSAEHAAEYAVHMLLSGPAGGIAAARYIGDMIGQRKLMTFDMGGTSTDVSLYDGELRLTTEGRIGPYPVGIAMVDIHTIGAGGGSLAYVDAGGLLHVGPESAGADPGPACYGRGGTLPTVTDANVVLGRLPATATLAGNLALDNASARNAVASCARDLNVTIEEAAQGILDIANEHMRQALRLISVQRGFDPQQFTLLCFGGAGGLHVCDLADGLNMTRALVPAHAGVFSAFGMLAAPRVRHLSRTHSSLLETVSEAALDGGFAELATEGRAALMAEGLEENAIRIARRVDLRYQGQSHSLTLDWRPGTDMDAAFHLAHELRFGHRLALPVELVTLRVAAMGPQPKIELGQQEVAQSGVTRPDYAQVHGIAQPVPIYRRADVDQAGVDGPAIVVDAVSTTYINSGWHGALDAIGNLVLNKHPSN